MTCSNLKNCFKIRESKLLFIFLNTPLGIYNFTWKEMIRYLKS